AKVYGVSPFPCQAAGGLLFACFTRHILGALGLLRRPAVVAKFAGGRGCKALVLGRHGGPLPPPRGWCFWGRSATSPLANGAKVNTLQSFRGGSSVGRATDF